MGRQIEALEITEAAIEDFLAAQRSRGLKESTLSSYRIHLVRLYKRLPKEQKQIQAGTIEGILAELAAEGMSTRTMNVFLTSCNRFLEYSGRKELQADGYRKVSAGVTPELTRTEYRRLLSTAKQLEGLHLVI